MFVHHAFRGKCERERHSQQETCVGMSMVQAAGIGCARTFWNHNDQDIDERYPVLGSITRRMSERVRMSRSAGTDRGRSLLAS